MQKFPDDLPCARVEFQGLHKLHLNNVASVLIMISDIHTITPKAHQISAKEKSSIQSKSTISKEYAYDLLRE